MGLFGRIITAYKQALLYLLSLFIYCIIAFLVMMFGFAEMGGAMNITDPTLSDATFFMGFAMFVIGYVLFIIGFMAAFLFSATKTPEVKKSIGFFEAYVTSVKLILELAVAIVLVIVFLYLGALIGGIISTILMIMGFITLMLFPLAAMLYVVGYLLSK